MIRSTAWADSLIKTAQDAHKKTTVREGSRQAITLAGEKAVGLALDYKAAGRDRTTAGALGFKGELAIESEVTGDTAAYEKNIRTFDAIRKSVKVD